MSSFSQANPDSMQKVFQKDLALQLEPFTPLLEGKKEEKTEDPNTFCKPLYHLAHALSGPARLMDYEPLALLLDTLAGVSGRWEHADRAQFPEEWTRFKKVIHSLVIVLKEACSVPALSLGGWMEENRSSILKITDELNTFQKKKREIQKETAVSSPPSAPLPSLEATLHKIDPSILPLFFVDLENHTQLLQEGLLNLELDAGDEETLAGLMRAAHSIKGAARVIGLEAVVHLAHALEECFLYIQRKSLGVDSENIQLFFATLDLLRDLFKQSAEAMGPWLKVHQKMIETLTQQLLKLTVPTPLQGASPTSPLLADFKLAMQGTKTSLSTERPERILRMTTAYLNRLMGFAGELLVESYYLQPFAEGLLKLKKIHDKQYALIDSLQSSYEEWAFGEQEETQLVDLRRKMNESRFLLARYLEEFEVFIRRHASLSDSLYREVVDSRLCPFNDGVEELPRMVRDLSHQLHKQVRLEIIGKTVTVDRDILDKLQIPLQHLLRNAVDHGIESTQERIAKGKSPVGTIRLEAYHRAGVLNIVVADDGRGIDLERLKKILLEKGLVDSIMLAQMRRQELFQFLFLPGFSTRQEITEISGRGFGLNTVQTMAHEVGGQFRIESEKDLFLRICLQLPLTLSTLRALLVDIAGEPYAVALARSTCTVLVDPSQIQWIENRCYTQLEGKTIGLIFGYQLLGLPPVTSKTPSLSVLVLTGQMNSYGIVVDRLLGERELVIQELDPRLGKVACISCGSLMEDGSPLLVLDVEDMLSAAETFMASKDSSFTLTHAIDRPARKMPRVLIVDDSITVREVESRILESAGFRVDSAVNGVDAWNFVRIQEYDLVITDIDMPRMNGLELIQLIRNSPHLKQLPVMIVSYKEGAEEKARGFKAGASSYLPKSSFQDDTFLDAVRMLLEKK